MKKTRCVMVWMDTEQRCDRNAIPGDEVCEPCRAKIEQLLASGQLNKNFRDVLTKSVRAPNTKNGHAPASRKPEESL
jgi:hypothetical protein